MSRVNFDPIKNNYAASECVEMNQNAVRVKPVTTWGLALESLRERHERESGEKFSQYKLAQKAGVPQSEYRNILRRGVNGPTLNKISCLLRAMGYGWKEWAESYEYESASTRELRAIPDALLAPALKGGPPTTALRTPVRRRDTRRKTA